MDWSDPGGATFPLSIALRRATDQKHKIGTLIFGPGGPGDSGVDRVVSGYTRFSPEIRSRFDIVSFDPRGVGRSSPMTCDPAVLDRMPDPVLTSPKDFDERLAYNRELWAGCRARTPVWDHADTLSTVRDVEALRVALGISSLTFHGSSYGTLLGQQYAERYPGRVRAMVLESVTDHSSRSTKEFLTAQAWALEDAFDAYDGDRQRWRELFATHGFDLTAVTHRGTKEPDYPWLTSMIASGGPYPHVRDLGVAIPAFCADWSIPVRSYGEYRSLLGAAERVAPDTHYPAQVFALTMCLGWPRVTNPQHDLNVHTRIPVLLLNSLHDPATGINWARNVERQLGRSGVLVTYNGAGHGSYTLSECTKQTADAYLIHRQVPPRGKVCT